MRTTIDIPDDLLRRTKAAAALRGIKLKDLVAGFLEKGLTTLADSNDSRPLGQRRPIPVTVSLPGFRVAALTNAEIEGILIEEDLEKLRVG